MAILDLVKKRLASSTDAQNNAPVVRTDPLDAKLHQGYDADASGAERNLLISSVAFEKDTDTLTRVPEKSFAESLLSRLPKAVQQFFDNGKSISSFTGQAYTDDDTMRYGTASASERSFQTRTAGSSTGDNLSAGTSSGVIGEAIDLKNMPAASVPSANGFQGYAGTTNAGGMPGGGGGSGDMEGTAGNGLPSENTNTDPNTQPSTGSGTTNPDPNTPPSTGGGNTNPDPNTPPTTGGGNANPDQNTPPPTGGGTTNPDPNIPSGPSYTLSISAGAGTENAPLSITITTNYPGPAADISYQISGVATGTVLSAGVDLGGGIWSVPGTDIAALTLLPPTSWSGHMDLQVTASLPGQSGQTTLTGTLPVDILGIASPPLLSVQTASGLENTSIALSISASLADTDGSETLTVTVSGVPSGAILSAGMDNGNGTWTISPADLTGLTLTPPANFSGSLALTVTATSAEAGTTSSVAATLSVGVAETAAPPIVSVQNVTGLEDTAVALSIAVQAAHTGGGETLNVTVGNIPAGATLSAGINNGDGTWTLTPSQLPGLTFTPPENFSGDLDLSITAVSSENGTTAQTTSSLHIDITGVPDAPVLSVGLLAGTEGQPMPLPISATLTDTDGSETLTVTISGLPAGAALSAGTDNGNGTWTLTPAQLPGLILMPPPYFSGTFNLSISAAATENGTTALTQLPPVSATVTGTASLPDLAVSPAAGPEGTPLALTIAAALTDTDGSETLSIVISGLPAGGSLSAGTDNGNGTWTLTPAQLSGLTFTPPANFSGSLQLGVQAISSEGSSVISNATTLQVSVTPVAHAPMLQISPVSGNEDASVHLSIDATPYDPGDIVTIVIGNLPAGATLSAGTDNGNGTWTLTPAQLSGLRLIPGADWNGAFNLSVSASASVNGTTASSTSALAVTIAPVADAPVLTVTGATGTENAPIPLTIAAGPAHAGGAETVSITVAGIPAGAHLSAGTDNGDGTWTLTPAQLSGLTLTPPVNFGGTLSLTVTAVASEGATTASTSTQLSVSIAAEATVPVLHLANATGIEDTGIALSIQAALTDTDGSETLSIVIGNVPVGAILSAGTNNGNGTWTLTPAQLSRLILTPPANFSGSIALNVTVMSSENGTVAQSTSTLSVQVSGVADLPSVTVQAASGLEGHAVALNITAASPDTDGSETVSVVIGNVPAGATLSAGTNNGNGTWILTPSQLSGLTLTPPAHMSGTLGLTVMAISSENGTTAQTTPVFLPVTVAGIADAPSLQLQAAAGLEDTSIPLVISAGAQIGETLSVTIGNVPVGATLSAGTDNGNGSWTLTPAQLSGLTITPPANFSGSIALSVTALSSQDGTTAQTSGTINIAVSGVADVPNLTIQPAIGTEGSAISLNITATSPDTDGSETLSVVIGNVPAGTVLSAGTNNGDGTWTLTPAQLSGLTLTPPAHMSGTLGLTVTAISSEDGTTAQTNPVSLPVTITGVAGAPVLSVEAATGLEDTAIPLVITAAAQIGETLSVTISNMPAGAILSAGTNNGNGSWTLTPAQLAGLTLTPPQDFSGQLSLNVTALSSQDGTASQTASILSVQVSGVADTPVLSVQAASGFENSSIPLNISAVSGDLDGSETLSVIISNVPAGATLSAGTNNGNGTWTLIPSQLAGLMLTPPAHFDGTLALSVAAVSSEGGTSVQTLPVSLPVSIAAVASVPVLAIQDATGLEDTAIPLAIAASVADSDEVLSISVSGIPAGASLSAGTNNGNGTWTLTPAQLSGLVLTPPANFSGGMSLTVTAISSENGTVAQATSALSVQVSGVADLPVVSVQPANGAEGLAIGLNIEASTPDTDGSETLSVVIGNVPVGASLSAGTDNGNGSWTLTPAQLSGLTITPPAHMSGTLSLTVTAISSENGTTAQTSPVSLPVIVTGVADAPLLTVQNATGAEDTAIPLAIAASVADSDEVLSISVSGVPAGAYLSAGTNNGNGTWTLTPAQLTGLSLMPPLDFSGQIPLSVTALSSEGTSVSQTASTLLVSVSGVADIPTLIVQPASGMEGGAIALQITAVSGDTDGSEALSVMIGNVPAGATLSAGTNNGNGTWTLTPAQLSGLTLTPPAHVSGTLGLTVTAISSENGTSAQTPPLALPVVVTGAADLPALSVTAATGTENTPIPLSIVAALTDTDGSETLIVTISNVPVGAMLSAGTDNGNGTWTLTPAQLSGLTLTPPQNWSGHLSLAISAISQDGLSTAHADASLSVDVFGTAQTPLLNVLAGTGAEDAAIPLIISAALSDTDGSETLNVIVSGVPAGANLSAGIHNGNGIWTLTPAQLSGLTLMPPANFSGSFILGVSAISHEGLSTAHADASLTVSVSGVADLPSVTAQAASGTEGHAVALNITAASPDTDGSETVSILIGNVPVGATLSAGTNNGDGTWTLTPAQLSGLSITPPAYMSGALTLSVTAISSENGTSAQTTAVSLPVTVSGVADIPALGVQNVVGVEDTAIPLIISASAHVGETLSVTIGNVPVGATLSAGTNNGNGTWTLSPAQLSGLTITPPANFSGSIALHVTALTMQDGTTAQTSTSMTVAVSGVADLPSVTVQSAFGTEGHAIALNITAATPDLDGSETVSVVIGNVPAGGILSAGTNNGNGTWTLTPTQLSGLTITPPAHMSGTLGLTVTAISSENGTSAQTNPVSLSVAVSGVADTPTLTFQNVAGIEDTAIPLTIVAALSDTDGSETLSITLSNVPSGATLSAGTNNGNGTWTLTPAQLAGLTLTPPANYSGAFDITVSATSTENGTTAQTNGTIHVAVTGVADTPVLTVQAVSGAEDMPILLNIQSALADTDGSETLSVTVAGLPAGASLSAGTNNGNGTWTLTPAQLSGLALTPPLHWSGDIGLTVTATAGEAGTTASMSAGLTVHVAGVATTPILSVLPATGNEDTGIPLIINAALSDTDGSESLSIRISGVPTGASLSAGMNNGNGTWTLTPAQLSGLTLTPPSHASGSIALTIQAISAENGTTASVSTSLPVTVAGLATAPSLSVTAATGLEDTALPLAITAALTDTDGSETLSVTIAGVPAGAMLSAGTNNGNGSWTLTPAQLSGLTLTPPANYSGSFQLTVTATSTENTSNASQSLPLGITITGIADAPILGVHAVTGSEDAPIALGITAGLADADGSENLSLTITGVPVGASLSAGTNIGNGAWTLAPAQLSGLTITPPVNYSGSFQLSVTATSTEGATSATTLGVLPVTVGGVADAPTLSVTAATGIEDTPVPLAIAAALRDTDGSETLSVTIGNVPAGATLSAGTNNGNGTWTLTPAQLTGLLYTPPQNASGLVTLTVTATSSENGTSANTALSLPVSIAGRPDTPYLSIQAAVGSENAGIPLTIASHLTDTDGSEILSITISGVPAGASLSAGLNAGNGVWVLTPAQLSGLTLTPPNNYNGAFALSVVALSSENGMTAGAGVSLPVVIAGVASTPVLTVAAAAGTEDMPVALSIAPSTSDSSEVLSVVISGVPSGATLSGGLYAGNGKWSLSPAQLSGLTITPPANFSGTMALTVTAVTTETNGTHATLSVPLNVAVAPVVDAPVLTLKNVSGNEDTAILLSIASALTDRDGSENLTVTVAGVPTGALLSAGTNMGGGIWSLTSAQLSGLKITPPANSDADFTLTVTAKSTESGGAVSSVSGNMTVTVNAVADAPTATAANVTVAGNQASLTIGGTLLDTDGSETITYVVHGVPDGFALNKGINNGDNTWSLKTADLSGLKLTAPEQFNGQLNLNVTAVSHDNNNSVAVGAATPFYTRFGNYSSGYLVDLGVGVNVGGIGVGVSVGVLPAIDLLPASGGLLGTKGIYAKEDTSFLIADAPGILSLPVLSTVLYALSKVQFSGVPDGVTFSAGTKVNATTWQFTSAQLNNLYMTPIANSDVDFTIVVSAKLLFGLADVALVSVPVHLMGVADMPTLSVSGTSGVEDGAAIPLTIAGALLDTDGSESISYLVSGMPAGFTLNRGIENGNGTWSLLAGDLAGLTVTPSANYSGSANLTVSAIATEREGDQTVKQQSISLAVTAVADAPIVAPAPASGQEDTPLSLNLGIALKDTDGSESISSVLISGLPAGASLTGATDNHNGTWSADVAHLDSVKFVPALHWSGDATLTVTAVSREGANGLTASTTSSLSVHIDPLADAPVTTATDSTGNTGQPIALHVGAALTDTDGSESLTAVISGVPDHVSLSAGLNNGDGSWTLSSGQLSSLSITASDGFTGDVSLSLTAYSRDGVTSIASSHQDFTVHILPESSSSMMFSANNSGYANQNGWLDASPIPTDNSGSASGNFFTDTSVAASTGTDHDQAFQSHNTG